MKRENVKMGSGKYFIYIGRLEKIKGTNILMEAWRMLGHSAPQLILCGNGELSEWCQEYIDDNRMVHVILKGRVAHEIAMEYLKDAAALVFPTQVYEGFPVSIVEAFSKGIPVIGSKIGNTEKMIDNGVNGLLFQYDSAHSLSSTIKDYLKMDIKRMGMAAYSKYIQLYEKEKNYHDLINIYNTVSGYDETCRNILRL